MFRWALWNKANDYSLNGFATLYYNNYAYIVLNMYASLSYNIFKWYMSCFELSFFKCFPYHFKNLETCLLVTTTYHLTTLNELLLILIYGNILFLFTTLTICMKGIIVEWCVNSPLGTPSTSNMLSIPP